MGWFVDERPGHEGYIQAYVQQEDGSSLWRELSYPERYEGEVKRIAVACTCGWRSPQCVAPFGTRSDESLRRTWASCSERRNVVDAGGSAGSDETSSLAGAVSSLAAADSSLVDVVVDDEGSGTCEREEASPHPFSGLGPYPPSGNA